MRGLTRLADDARAQPKRQGFGPPLRSSRPQPSDDVREIGLTIEAANREQLFDLRVVRREIVVTDWPRAARVRAVGAKFCRTEPRERRTVPFRFATEIEVLLRHERTAVTVTPLFAAFEFAVVHDALHVERAAVARQAAALLDQRDAQAGAHEAIRGCGAASAGAHDDHIEIASQRGFSRCHA